MSASAAEMVFHGQKDMQDDTDGSLLTRFANHHDEDAFRTLTKRHLGFVYHTALRRCGNRQLAEEASQNVLCAVAKKAGRLAKHPERLPAWLHRATLFETSKAMRTESSRRRRMRLEHPDEIPATGTDDAWSAALPHLDLALDRLSDSDRRVVLQHFFEGKSFVRIGENQSRPAATVQKQCRRALEKLARILRGRGVALSAAGLATGLGTQTAKAAPPVWMKSAAAMALAQSSGYSTTPLTLHMAAKSKAVLPLAAVALLTPLALQQIAISRAEARNDSLRTALADEPPAARAGRSTSITRATISISTRITIEKLSRTFAAANRQGRMKWFEFEEMIASLDADQLAEFIPQTRTLTTPRQERNELLRHLVTALTKLDPERAVRTTSAMDPQRPVALNAGVENALFLWTSADPDEAIAWLHGLHEQRPEGSGFAFLNYQSAVAAALIENGSPRAAEVITMTDEVRPAYVIRDALGFPDQLASLGTGRSEAADIVRRFARFLPYIRDHVPEDGMERIGFDRKQAIELFLFENLDHRMTLEDPIPGRIMDIVELLPAERHILATAHALRILQLPYNTHPRPERADVDAAARRWLETHLPEQATEVFEEARATSIRNETYQIERGLENLEHREVLRDGDILNELERRDFSGFPQFLPRARDLARRIKDPEKRAAMIHRLEAIPAANP